MNTTYNLVKAELSQLIIIDMQTKLMSAMQPDAMQVAIKNCAVLIQAANILAVSTIVTEQYPQGLGATLPELKQHMHATKPIEKTVFSATGTAKFNQQLHRDQSQMILTGMEAHICVLQTALALKKMDKQIFVVEDAIISRNLSNKSNAIARMRDAGCIITNTESVLFEWLSHAQHSAFKAVSQLIR